VLNEVNVDEHQALADLCSGYFPGAGLLLQRYGMNVQERCGGLQIERGAAFHGRQGSQSLL